MPEMKNMILFYYYRNLKYDGGLYLLNCLYVIISLTGNEEKLQIFNEWKIFLSLWKYMHIVYYNLSVCFLSMGRVLLKYEQEM